MQIVQLTDEIARRAAELVSRGEGFAEFDDASVPIYTTDPHGALTYYNPACIAFAGRTPALTHDLWCVTWRLLTLDGAHLPHDECPMAIAIRQKRMVRGAAAIAEKPDGTKTAFLPFPTPLFRDYEMVGAINVLVGVEGEASANFLQDQVRRYRRLADYVDEGTSNSLNALASEYEDTVRRMELWSARIQ
jgi:hypothetical protein